MRIRTNPTYHPNRKLLVTEMMEALQVFVDSGNHEFWSDGLSLRNILHRNAPQIIGHRQITDLYLLALATHRGGRLATFDQNVPLQAVPHSNPENLCLIP